MSPLSETGSHSLGTEESRSGRMTHRPRFAELLIDCEQDRTLRALLVGMLRESRG
jgi:hypothetical protein